jgi:hypothetical protein
MAHDVIHRSLWKFVQEREGESADIIRNVGVLLNHPICWVPERCGIPGIPCWLARDATHDYGGLWWGCGRPATRCV